MESDLVNIIDKNFKLFLDYDGTLVPLTSRPEDARPDPELFRLLDALDKKFNLFIITGRSAHDIQSFIDSKYEIIAMHGAQTIHKGGNPVFEDNFHIFKEICDEYYGKLKYLETRFPGLMVINKGGGLQFHYYFMKQESFEDLLSIVEQNIPRGMELYLGKYVMEYRIKGINKGTAILNRIKPDEKILFAGDDTTDEEAFSLLQNHVTIKIGDGETKAKYRMKDYKELRSFLWRVISRISSH